MIDRKNSTQQGRGATLAAPLAACTLVLGLADVAPAFAADAAAAPADAAEQVVGLEEITVTAQRRAQNARDVPISLTVFSSTAVEQQNFQGVESYFGQTPNVSFTTNGSRDRKVLALRGVSDLLSPDANIRQGSFAFYMDEFDVGGGTSNPELVDVDRIEVLRGPQGTYFGRNSIGGAVNITTRQPTNEVFMEASSQYSSFNTLDSHVIANLPLVDNVLALRVVGRYERSDGNIKNINPIGGGNDNTYRYGKAALRFTPNDRLTIDLSGVTTHENTGMRDGVPSGVLASFSQFLYQDAPFNGKASPDGVGFWPNNRDRVNFNRPQDVGTNYYYVENRVKYVADSFTVTNVLGYINSSQFLHGDIDGGSYDLFYEHENIQRDVLSEEFRISSNPGKKIDWTAGMYFSHAKGNTNQYTYAGNDVPGFLGLNPNDEVTATLSDADAKSYALFGEGVWHATEKLAVTLGGRFTHEKIETAAYDSSSGVIVRSVDGDKGFSNFSPRLSLNYALTDKSNVYGTVSRGFKSGGLQPSTKVSKKYYDPETLTNYEVGYKSELLERRLQLNAALFFMDWKNLQAESAFGVQGPNGIEFISAIGNAKRAQSYGAEVDLTARVAQNWTVAGGAGYDHARFTDFKDAFPDGEVADLSGKQLPNAPKWTAHASVQYDRSFLDHFDGFARLEWNYKASIVSNMVAEVHEGFPYQVPSYNVFNFRLGVSRDNWDVVAFAENLLDKNYYTSAYEKAFVGGMYVNPSYRNFGVKFTVRTK